MHFGLIMWNNASKTVFQIYHLHGATEEENTDEYVDDGEDETSGPTFWLILPIHNKILS